MSKHDRYRMGSSGKNAATPTLHDVALLCGVSASTVSRVVTNRGYVRPETRRTIEDVVRSLGYVPNHSARSLKTRRTNVVALIVPEITNPFFTTVAMGVERIANQHGLTVIFGNSGEDPQKEREYLRTLASRQVDGFIIAPADETAEHLSSASAQGIPFVQIDRVASRLSSDAVHSNNVDGARSLVEHLIEKGHRRIAIINGDPRRSSVARERQKGFEEALFRHGNPLDERLISQGNWWIEDAYRRTLALVDQSPCPTAIFAANNFMTIGVLTALRQRQITVPDDVALVSYDDDALVAAIYPFLTSIRQPAYSMGLVAMRLLRERIEGEVQNGPRDVVLSSKMVIRRSCGCAASDVTGQEPFSHIGGYGGSDPIDDMLIKISDIG